MKTIKDFILFGVAGVLGFGVDTAVLYSLSDGMGPFYARALSFLAAVFATWIVNRTLAFGRRKSAWAKGPEFCVYLSLMLIGGALNYAIYSWLVVSYEVVHRHLVIGVAAGSIAGMAINFGASRFLLYRFKA